LQNAPERVTAGVEPDPEHAYDDRDGEKDAQDVAATAPVANERAAAQDEEHRGVREREPGDPRLAEDLPVLEADFGEKERRPAEDRGDDRLFSFHRVPACEG
jgi:hypothetical protein